MENIVYKYSCGHKKNEIDKKRMSEETTTKKVDMVCLMCKKKARIDQLTKEYEFMLNSKVYYE